MTKTLLSELKSGEAELIAIRRDIHQHPETAFEENRTSDVVAERLAAWGIPIHRGLARTGVVGTLKGKRPGQRVIGLRADMDALNLQEKNGFAHCSVNPGKMHACGHDGHTAMLLGAARHLARDPDFAGTVHFIFQPAEESEGGARVMIEEGLFEKFPCDAVYGMHNMPGIPVGQFAIRPGPLTAASDTWTVTITGSGGHGAMPHQGTDPTMPAAQFVLATQTIIGRNVPPNDTAVVSVGHIGAGNYNAANVIPATVTIRGTARSYTAATRDLLERRLGELARSLAAAHGCAAEYHYLRRYPPVVNTQEQTDLAVAAAAMTVGAANVDANTEPVTGGEDFAFMLQKKPGAYIMIGNGGDANGGCAHVHTPLYDFNDEILTMGTAYWVNLVGKELGVEFLREPGMTRRIAVGGFQHETNTFAPTKADYAAFEHGGGWPGLQRGAAMAEALRDKNIPASGAFKAFHAQGHRTVGLVWANATPSAQVTGDAYERIAGGIVAELAQALPVDAVYLDLHGAMVAEHVDDGEGELLRRVRAVVGPRVPVVASLDLHANVTRAMVEHADGLVAYRTYPHVDMADTGARAASLLDSILRAGDRPARAFRQLEFLIPLTTACTLIEPAQLLYRELARLESESGVVLSFAPGFPMADFAECGPSVFGYGAAREQTVDAVERLAHLIADAERDFAPEFLSPDDAVQRAMARGAPGLPVVLADTQDNPGAGGNGDTTGVLAALLRNRAQDAVLGLLVDPVAAKQAHAAGVGATLPFALGEQSGLPGHVPLQGRFTVERLGDGNFPCKGGLYDGAQMRLGPMALLRQDGVRVVLSSRKVQAANQDMFRHLGVEPAQARIVVVKSSVHFRADFQPIAREVLVVLAPGPAKADPASFAWTRLRAGMRLRPLGPAFAGAPSASV